MGSSKLGHSSRRKRPSRSRSKPSPTSAPDLHTVMGLLADARSLITCATVALEAGERALDEACTLRAGLSVLRDAYNGLDAAAGAVQ